MQKIKNSYRVNEKSSMNTSNSPFQCWYKNVII